MFHRPTWKLLKATEKEIPEKQVKPRALRYRRVPVPWVLGDWTLDRRKKMMIDFEARLPPLATLVAPEVIKVEEPSQAPLVAPVVFEMEELDFNYDQLPGGDEMVHSGYPQENYRQLWTESPLDVEDLVPCAKATAKHRPWEELALYIHYETMLVTCFEDLDTKASPKDFIVPIPLDGIDGYFSRMIDQHITVKDQFFHVYTVKKYLPFKAVELRGEKVLAEQASWPHEAQGLLRKCEICCFALRLWRENQAKGTYGFADLIAKNIVTITQTMQGNSCICKQMLVNRLVGIVDILMDGIIYC